MVKSAHRPRRSERLKGANGRWANRLVGGSSMLMLEAGASLLAEVPSEGGGPHDEMLVGT